jgi:hypothetical protein
MPARYYPGMLARFAVSCSHNFAAYSAYTHVRFKRPPPFVNPTVVSARSQKHQQGFLILLGSMYMLRPPACHLSSPSGVIHPLRVQPRGSCQPGTRCPLASGPVQPADVLRD